MDLNYLFRRQQVERSLAISARNRAAKHAHEELARNYEREIERATGGRILFPDGPNEPARPVGPEGAA